MVSEDGQPHPRSQEIINLRREELLGMPSEVLVEHTLEVEDRLKAAEGVNSALARHQQLREEENERDDLTGLFNRKGFYDRVEGMVWSGDANFGVIFIDMSRFKVVNDERGHDAGDEALVGVAKKLQTSLREGDDLAHDAARYGGDEFSILCDLTPRDGELDLSNGDRLRVLIERIRTGLKTYGRESGLESLGLDAAIGGAVFEPGMTVSELMKNADKSMYTDKYLRRPRLNRVEAFVIKLVSPILKKAGVRQPD